ncbi:M23 family metallopeptidase [Nocardia sp. NPDC050408]|uniref:M23 family metallopeptidase n=1 Tax=Nocardia sp. NPDC050408 TaxID=3364319 RepID=UPI0037B9D3DC
MGPFSLTMSNPFVAGAAGTFSGGPGVGGHRGPHWYEAFGMDLDAPVGTEVRAVFDGVVTDFKSPVSSGKAYGHQVWIRAANGDLDPNAPGGVGGFYTHLTTVGIAIGTAVTRGQVLGAIVSFGGIPRHLHLAIAERRDGTNFGVDLYQAFKDTINSATLIDIEFQQNGNSPSVTF